MTIRSIETLSDVALGTLLLVAGTVAIRDGADLSSGHVSGTEPGVFEIAVGGVLVALALALVARAVVVAREPAAPWRLRTLAIVVGTVVLVDGMAAGLGDVALRFGPIEIAALIALKLAAAIALARMSRLRAAGMAALGLLLSMVGIDTVTGVLRLTMGMEPLVDGVSAILVLFGIVVAADAMTCLASPSRYLAGYGRFVAGWGEPRLPTATMVGLRVAAAVALVGVAAAAYALSARVWEIGAVLALGAFGVAARLLGWNRLMLLIGLNVGSVFEENIRRSLLLSDGDPMVFLQRPISAGLVIATVLVLVAAAALSVWRARRQVLPAAP
jgi:TctA family transporter